MVGLKRMNQGGAIVTFIVVAVVLTLAVVGTAYFVKQRGEQVRRDQAVAQADKLAKSSDSSPTPATTTKPKSADSGASTPKPPATPTQSKPATIPGDSASTPATTAQPTPAPATSAQPLPTTGPESALVNVLALGLLVASATAYATSLRTPSRSL